MPCIQLQCPGHYPQINTMQCNYISWGQTPAIPSIYSRFLADHLESKHRVLQRSGVVLYLSAMILFKTIHVMHDWYNFLLLFQLSSCKTMTNNIFTVSQNILAIQSFSTNLTLLQWISMLDSNPAAIGSRKIMGALLCSTLRSAHSRDQEVCIILGNSCPVVPQLEWRRWNSCKFLCAFVPMPEKSNFQNLLCQVLPLENGIPVSSSKPIRKWLSRWSAV